MAALTSSPGARRILIVAQDGINRHIMASILAEEGHELALAGDGAEALALVQRQPFDLVVIDVALPTDGLDTTRHIRGLPGAQRNVPILALSAHAAALERQAAAGVTASLSKPFEWDRILAAIERHALRPAACNVETQPACAPAVTLVDSGVLLRLRETVGPDNLHTMTRMAIDAYALRCDEMLHEDAQSVVTAREAHKIKGSAGTFGLMRISVLASEIEGALERNLSVAGVLRQLQVATVQTREELRRMGALGSEPGLGVQLHAPARH